jgi:hypothetical protein
METSMKKTIVGVLGAATIAVTVAATATDAAAQWRGRGWGYGPGPGAGIAAGVIGGALVAGAIIASRPPGYVVYEGYGQPVSAPGCYWASQPLYDGAGRVVGYTGQPVQICPGYSGPPPGYSGGPPPGYGGGPPPGYGGGPPPGYGGGPPPGYGPPPGGYADGPPPGYAGGPPPGAAPGYAGGPPAGDPVAYCMQRFHSYDPKSGTYLGNDGLRHSCP